MSGTDTNSAVRVALDHCAPMKLGSRLWALLLSTPFRVALIGVLLLAGAFPWFDGADPDLFARVATGELILERGQVPVPDVFAFTPTNAIWFDHEWLISVLFYLVAVSGGDVGLFFLKLVFFFATTLIVLNAQRHRGIPFDLGTASFLILLPEILNGFLPNIRCQMATFLGVAFWLYVHAASRNEAITFSHRRNLLLVLPLLMIPWANSHGGFVVGLAQSGLFLCGRLSERSKLSTAAALSFLGCLVAMLVNPWGASYVSYIVSASLHPRELISEWGAVPAGSLRWILLVCTSLIICVGAWRLRFIKPPDVHSPDRVSPSWDDFVLVFLLLYQGFTNDRLAALAALGVSVIGPPYLKAVISDVLSDLTPFLHRRALTLAAAARGAFVLLSLISLFSVVTELLGSVRKGRTSYQFSYQYYPQSAVAWLCQHGTGGNLLIHFNEASYALWALRGRYRVAIDGRYEELYPEETFMRALAAIDPTHSEHATALKWIAPDYIIAKGLGAQPGAYPGFKILHVADSWRVLGHKVPDPLNSGGWVLSGDDVWSMRCIEGN